MERLKLLREAKGLTQADLAAVAGLSRQMVGAIEAGRNRPGVTAALALAQALGSTVEDLFGLSKAGHQSIFGREPGDGAPVVVARVAETLVYATVPEHGAAGPYWSPADGTLHRGRVRLFDAVQPAGTAVAGCDPALGLAAALLPGKGPLRMVAIQASSAAAARALGRGLLHAAVVHGPAGSAPVPPGVKRVRLARWEVGVAALRNASAQLEPAARGDATVAGREPGAESQRAFERALTGLGLVAAGSASHRVRGPVASGHLEAARLVACGAADLGLTMRPAAHALGLDFATLEEHDVELWVAAPWRDHPGVQALCDLVSSSAFGRRLTPFEGYDLSGAGDVVG